MKPVHELSDSELRTALFAARGYEIRCQTTPRWEHEYELVDPIGRVVAAYGVDGDHDVDTTHQILIARTDQIGDPITDIGAAFELCVGVLDRLKTRFHAGKLASRFVFQIDYDSVSFVSMSGEAIYIPGRTARALSELALLALRGMGDE